MSDVNPSPVLKFIIERDDTDETGDPKFTITSENVAPVTTFSCSDDDEIVEVPTTSVAPECYSVANYIKCAVPCCYNYFDGQRQEFIGISYFPFPESPSLREQWIKAIKLPDDKDPVLLKVCSEHFYKNDFQVVSEDGDNFQRLMPAAIPSKKLGFTMLSPQLESSFDDAGNFVGIDNPLMDTVNDQTTNIISSAVLTTNKDVMPVITNVVSMGIPPLLQIQTGELESVSVVDPSTGFEHSEVHSRPAKICSPRNTCQVNRVVDFIGEENITNSDIDDGPTPCSSKNPEKGLIVVPATVKLPPRLPKLDLVGDSIAGSSKNKEVRELGASTLNRLPTLEMATPEGISGSVQKNVNQPSDNLSPTSSPLFGHEYYGNLPVRNKRGRRCNKAEMMRREEEDEWEPSFWSKRKLKKDGFGDHLVADKKRIQDRKMRNYECPKEMLGPSDETTPMQEGLTEEDEGWRILEPIATIHNKNGSSVEGDELEDSNHPLALLEVSMSEGGPQEKESSAIQPGVRRRPGPASKTCRPRYVPHPREALDENVINDNQQENTGNVDENGIKFSDNRNRSLSKTEDSYDENDPKLLIDWSFFKSLLPDLGKLEPAKRLELKSFVLDTLNSAIYEAKPIIP